MKDTVAKYLRKKSFFSSNRAENPHSKEGNLPNQDGLAQDKLSFSNKFFPIAVCIPAYNEYPNIIYTLQSLAVSSAICGVKIEAVICVNNREDSPIETKQNNQFLVQMLEKIAQNEFFVCDDSPCGVRITVLDFTKNEKQFKSGYGVGWARKIAMDYALERGAEVIASLDADTLVSTDYCGELERFRKQKMDFATMDFTHQGASTSELQEVINHYEYWMKDHSKKLKETGTPFYYMALGSLIVTSNKMYAQVGGMKNRLAGEDFYFIQEAIKILLSRATNLEQIKNPVPILNCQVEPEARISDRVLFGTGETLSKVNTGNKKIRFYKDSSYDEVGKIISIFNELNCQEKALDFPNMIEKRQNESVLAKKTFEFFENDRFFENWDKLVKTANSNTVKIAVSFHCKLDGLKIIRLIHYLEK